MVSQWWSSVNLNNWNTLEDHWKTTGRPLEDHWKHTGMSPVAFQCTLGSKFQAHWIAIGLPLEDHWLRVRVTDAQIYWFISFICTHTLRCWFIWFTYWNEYFFAWRKPYCVWIIDKHFIRHDTAIVLFLFAAKSWKVWHSITSWPPLTTCKKKRNAFCRMIMTRGSII